MIKITNKNFNLEDEFMKISSVKNGGYSFFLGTVREDIQRNGQTINSIFLECYEDLAIKQLSNIRKQAIKYWSLNNCLIVHRIGALSLGEKIVLIITASSHRENAIKSCEFIIDNLKVNAAFWKFYISDSTEIPIKHKKKDLEKFLKWSDVVNFQLSL